MFKIQSINRHRLMTDGEGVTTLVALFACPLKCKYCINSNVLSKDVYKEFTKEELWEKLSIDYCYFLTTGGGITFGGGESLLYIEDILELRKILPEGVRIYLETSLNVPLSDDTFAKMFESDNPIRLIVDIKTLDKDLYKEYTGSDNSKVLKNLDTIKAMNMQKLCKIRIPIIPNYKDVHKANSEADIIRKMGFNDIDVFEYVIRDYMEALS